MSEILKNEQVQFAIIFIGFIITVAILYFVIELISGLIYDCINTYRIRKLQKEIKQTMKAVKRDKLNYYNDQLNILYKSIQKGD